MSSIPEAHLSVGTEPIDVNGRMLAQRRKTVAVPILPRSIRATILAMALFAAGCGDDAAPSVSSAPDESTSRSSTAPATPDTDSAPWPALPSPSSVQRWTVEVIERFDHDPAAFTQGLEVVDGVGFESTGRYGESTIRRFDPATGVVGATAALDGSLFGEGLTVVDGVVVQLTWQEGRALRWDAGSLELLGSVPYDGDHEGWGVCADGDTLLVSDGTASVRRVDPLDFTIVSAVDVRHDGEPVELLNELECVDGLVVANILNSDQLVVFDAASGAVLAWIDASPLVQEMAATLDADRRNVLNGIALLEDDTFLLTGKRWPTTFRVRVVAT